MLKNPWKKLRAFIFFLIACIISGVLIFCFMPPRYPIPENLAPAGATVFFRAAISEDTDAGKFIYRALCSRLIDDDSGALTKTVLKAAVDFLLPVRVYGWLMTENSSAKKLDYAVFVDFGRRNRLIRLFHRFVFPDIFFSSELKKISSCRYPVFTEVSGSPKGFLPGAYNFAGDLLVFARNHAALTELLPHMPDDVKGGGNFSGAVAEFVSGSRADVKFLLWNEEGVLTDLVRRVENKVAFAAIPSIDIISSISSDMSVDGLIVTGFIRFAYIDASREDEVQSDIEFLYGSLRRIARAAKLDLRGEIIQDKKACQIDFTIKGIESFIDEAITDGN